MKCLTSVACAMLFAVSAAQAQGPENTAPLPFARPQGPAAPPTVISLQDALDRARRIDIGVQSALADVAIAREDLLQAKAARLPSVTGNAQYIGTQGNGITPNGRFVGSDGVHVYRPMATVREEISPGTILKTDYRRASAAQALANARVDIARRGLDVAVAEKYYSLVAAQRRYAAIQQGVQAAQRFLEITQQQERAGQAAHSDAVKAEIQLQQQRRSLQEVLLAIENARLNLAVLLSPTLDENFTVVDDLDSARVLPPFAELQAMAEKENPELKAADAAIREASFNVRSARNAFLPTLTLEANYGMESNALKLHSTQAAEPDAGRLPNLGYSVNFNLSIPIFDWGSTRSKLRQAQTKEKQAGLQLTQAQRQIAGNLYAFYNEAVAARAAVDLARSTADLAAESLRLINLRYQAGESTVLEVVDAQNTLIESRADYDGAQVRFRVAVTSLQSVTGGF
jgi:outer membrane protein TolC